MSNRRNIILITIDSLRADHLSCLGYPKRITPFFDDLAKEGALFTQAISNGPNTYCSFPSIMTSSYAMMNLLGDALGYPPRWVFLSPNNATIAEVLRNHGYETAAFHRNPWVSAFFHYDRGFRYFEDSLNETSRSSFFLREIKSTSRVSYYVNQLVEFCRRMFDRSETTASGLNEKAASWLREQKPEKFFLWLHYMDVHAPFIPPRTPVFQRMSAIKLAYKTRMYGRSSRKELQTLRDLYDKEIQFLDQEMESFLLDLQNLGVSLDNCYVIVTADHGEQFMEHGYLSHGKLYDETIRVPLIIAGPEIESDTVFDGQVSLLDLSPTLLELLNIKSPRSFLGTSLLAKINEQVSPDREVFSENLVPTVSLRTETKKCIVSYRRKKRVELYDLKTDPMETCNLAKEEKETVRKFELKIAEHLRKEYHIRKLSREHVNLKRYANKRFRQEEEQVKQRLKALGYY